MTTNFELNLSQCLAHTLVWLNQEEERATGVPAGTFRNDFSPSAPPPRNAAQEGRDMLQAQVDLAPQQYAASAQYSPQYADLANANLSRFLLGNGTNQGFLQTYTNQVQPAFQQSQIDSTRTQRTADIADVENFGGRAVAAFRAANPQQQALVDRLNTEATAGLDAGYNLPTGMRRTVSQSVRAGQADRGLGFGPADVYGETLAQSDAAANYYGQNFNRAQQVAGINAATSADPFTLVTGRASGAGGMGLLSAGQQGAGNTGMPNFDPFSAYGSDLSNTNYNANAAARIAGSNANAGVVGGLLSC